MTIQLKVSSVLNKDVKNYGKQFLIDGNDETCWNSHQGLPQWIQMEFPSLNQINGIKIMFQGGFAAGELQLQIKNNQNEWETCEIFYPQDVNILQEFTLSKTLHSLHIRLLFTKSFDFFGRIIVYKLDCC